eukprot:gene8222-9669_t
MVHPQSSATVHAGGSNAEHHHTSLDSVFQGLKKKINDLDEDDLLRHIDTSRQVVDLTIDPYAEEPKKKDKRNIMLKAIGCLILGTAMIFLFADAFVETITKFSHRIGIPPFYISFIVAPFALNASELSFIIIWSSGNE